MPSWLVKMVVSTLQELVRGVRTLIISQNQEGSQNHPNRRRCLEWKDIMWLQLLVILEPLAS